MCWAETFGGTNLAAPLVMALYSCYRLHYKLTALPKGDGIRLAAGSWLKDTSVYCSLLLQWHCPYVTCVSATQLGLQASCLNIQDKNYVLSNKIENYQFLSLLGLVHC